MGWCGCPRGSRVSNFIFVFVFFLFLSWKCLTLDDPPLDGRGVVAPGLGEVLEDVLGRLGFAGAGLPGHDDRLTLPLRLHVAVRLVR